MKDVQLKEGKQILKTICQTVNPSALSSKAFLTKSTKSVIVLLGVLVENPMKFEPWCFSDFLNEVTATQSLKIDLTDFLQKN